MFSNVDRDALEDRYGVAEIQDVASRDPEADPATVVDEAIRDAVAEAAAFLSSRYTLNDSLQAPESLLPLVCDIARFRLYDEAPPDVVKDAYARAIATLKDIAKGLANVFDSNAAILAAWTTAEGATTATSGVVAYRENRGSTDTPARVFTRDTLAGF